jgi:hypothetical protein
MKKVLLTTTAVAGLMFAAAPAQAFDENVWTWTNTVDQATNIDVNVASDIAPDSHVEIEHVQTLDGDVRAEVNFDGDYLSNDSTEFELNPDAVGLEDTETPISATFSFEGNYDANADGPNITNANLTNQDFEGFDGEVAVDTETSSIGVQPSDYNFDVTMNGTLTTEAPDVDLEDLVEEDQVTLDAATELGTLVGNATALANYRELQVEGATYLDEVQTHTALNEDGFGVEALANAGSAENPVEAAVDLSATAISNYMSMEGAADAPNNVLLANVEQTTNANVQALATATQDLSGYNGVGGFSGIDAELPGVVSRLNATAIGNYSSISFGPNVELGDPLDE